MALECNIDARGKAARMRLGIIVVLWGLVLGVLTFTNILPSTLGWVITACTIAGGLFAIWEARVGWCVVRAMGFKTKI
jgi:hypothetical protein